MLSLHTLDIRQLVAQDAAQIDVAYEKIMSEPTVQLKMLADALDVADKVLIAMSDAY